MVAHQKEAFANVARVRGWHSTRRNGGGGAGQAGDRPLGLLLLCVGVRAAGRAVALLGGWPPPRTWSGHRAGPFPPLSEDPQP